MNAFSLGLGVTICFDLVYYTISYAIAIKLGVKH